jgi:hypothetical protein
MKRLVIRSLELFASFGFVLTILGFAISGYSRAAWGWSYGWGGFGHPLLGLVFGAVTGFIVATLVFGALFLVIDIADNARRTRELIEAESSARRTPAA